MKGNSPESQLLRLLLRMEKPQRYQPQRSPLSAMHNPAKHHH